MDYNPFVSRLTDTDEALEQAAGRRAELVDTLDWAAGFDPEAARREMERIHADAETRSAELERLTEERDEIQATVRRLGSKTPQLERDASVGLRVYRLLSSDHGRAVERLKAHKADLKRAQKSARGVEEQCEETGREVAELTARHLELGQARSRFDSFDRDEVSAAIEAIDHELSVLAGEREVLHSRADDVERAVEGPLRDLRLYEEELDAHQSRIAKLQSKLSRLKRQLAEAKDIDERLSRASSGFERKELHEECERDFDNGSPRAVINGIRSKVRPIETEIGGLERQVSRLRRDMAKTERRITELAAVAARDITSLVIDGNNCCYEGSDFIGLTALIPMTESLAERYAVTVVFDASIRRRLGVNDGHLSQALPAVNVHVVASRTKADETILDAADQPTAWVVSNDRFGEYRDKGPIKDQRLIRHEIVSGRVLVHDLQVNEPLSTGQ